MSYRGGYPNSGTHLSELLAVLLLLEVLPTPVDVHILLVAGDDLVLNHGSSGK